MLVLVAAVSLLLGLLRESVRPMVVSIVSSLGSLVFLATGIVRSSRPPQGDRDG